MKVLLMSQSDSGGAGHAATRLYNGLKELGVDANMLCGRQSKTLEHSVSASKGFEKVAVKLKLFENLDRLPLQLYDKDESLFSPQWVPSTSVRNARSVDCDLINVHWVNHGYLSIEGFAKLGKPIALTLHDMWGFSGGCHYSGDCDRYTAQCGKCPQLHSKKERDLSRWVWRRKHKAWAKNISVIIAPSQWLAECAQRSSLFSGKRIEVIPNGLDLNKYKPITKLSARHALNIPQDKKIVLFGASYFNSDYRKGFDLLLSALKVLKSSNDSPQIQPVVFGGNNGGKYRCEGDDILYLGKLRDTVALALAYSAADVMVVPSRQEAFGQTASESFACGTPVVAFNTTGLKDIVDHQKNGYLASPFDVGDLARGIQWVLESTDRYKSLSEAAYAKAKTSFSHSLNAQRYSDLFVELLN